MGVPFSGDALTAAPALTTAGKRRSLAGETLDGVIGPLRREPSKSREKLREFNREDMKNEWFCEIGLHR